MQSPELSSRLTAVAIATLLCGSVSPSRADAGVAGIAVYEALQRSERVRVVVSFVPPAAPAGDLQALSRRVAEVKRRVLFDVEPEEFRITTEWQTVSAVAGDISLRGLELLLRDPNVDRIDVDVPGHIALAQSVSLIRANELISQGLSGAGVTVAVLDTGIDGGHPDLSDDIVDEACFCQNADGSGCCPGGGTSAMGSGAARDEQGHGTNVAGIVTSRGSVAPRGVAPDAKIVAVRVMDASGVASGTAQVISGLEYVLTSHPEVRVVNMSLGFESLFSSVCDSSASFTSAFAQVIGSLKGRGTIVFASSLNSGSSSQIGLPACISSAVAVGAVYDDNLGSVSFGCTDSTTRADQVACFSNSNALVDILAPGAATTAPGIGGGVSTWLGTSQASPHAAGAAALLLQAKGGLSPDQILTAFKATGAVVTDPKNGMSFPRIDVAAALRATP
jgi:subtilisin family serine protease